MTSRDVPAWLEELEARFGAVIRTPLDRATGTLTATPALYDAQVLGEALDGPKASGANRLAVYNRQYWFRLFEVLQAAFPLTTRLLGHWSFNDYAGRFLLAHPPHGWDLDRAPDGFETFLSASLDDSEVATREALIENSEAQQSDSRRSLSGARGAEPHVLIESARIDVAWRGVFGAPRVTPYKPSPSDAARLLDARLTPSPAVAFVEEHWPLLELRKTVRDDTSETPVALPTRLPHARWWALVRRDEGMGQLPLAPREAELFTLLSSHTVADALGLLERACTDEERAALPAKTQAWLARSVELDFWVGAEWRA